MATIQETAREISQLFNNQPCPIEDLKTICQLLGIEIKNNELIGTVEFQNKPMDAKAFLLALARTVKQNGVDTNFIEGALSYLQARGIGETQEESIESSDFDLNAFRTQVYGTAEAPAGSNLDFIFSKQEEGQQLAEEAFMSGRFVAHKTYEELQKKGVTGDRSEELEVHYGATFQGLSQRSTQNIHNIGFSRIYNWLSAQTTPQAVIDISHQKEPQLPGQK